MSTQTVTADQIFIENTSLHTAVWGKTKATTASITASVRDFLAESKNKVKRFFQRHPVLEQVAAGTAIWTYFTFVFVGLTVLATYAFIFSFTFLDSVFGL